ncbi:MAG TPA: protein kinase [Terriglobales bacterium]|nr:protein kinase [Terriglobales bacterium]
MTPERWQQVKGVLQQVLEISSAHRHAYLDQVCQGDESLRLEVESLLADGSEGVEGFLEAPLWTSAVFKSGLSDSWIGRRIGAYEVVALIGEGGMGSVYRGIRADEQYEMQVAIKIVRQGLGSAFALAQFRAERQILANLDHPHIARLLDGGTTETGLPYLVMELIDGEPIDLYCNSRKLSIDERLRLFLRVCAGVQYAHQHLVIHRDLKPGNIFVTKDGTPKLLDFGIAKILDPASATRTSEVTLNMMRMLTPEYASPEQVRGEVVTTASDVYSLGVVLFRLLTEQHPFKGLGRSPDEILLATRDSEPPKPSTAARWESATVDKAAPPNGGAIQTAAEGSPEKLGKRLRGDLDNIVLMALRKEPQRRYASAEHFAEDIRRHLGSLPVKARPDTFRYRASKFLVRHKKGVIAAAGVAALLIALMAGIAWEGHVAREQRMRAERRFQDVRSLANSLIFDVHDSIQDLPGATAARKLIVDKALHYLDSLEQESQGDVSLRRELAEAYKRIGDVQGNEFFANLGDTSNALKSYQKALAIRKSLSSPSSQDVAGALALAELYRLVSQTQLVEGEVSAALESSQDAVKLMEPMDAAHPGDPKVVYELLADYQSVANILGGDVSLSNMGDNEGALVYRQKQLDTAERFANLENGSPRGKGNLAIAISTMGDQLLQAGHPSEALQNYLRAQPLFQDVAYHSNKGPRGKYLLGLLYERISLVQLVKGDIPAAMTAANAALKLSMELAESDPRDAQSGVTLIEDYKLVADLESRTGHDRDASLHLERAFTLMPKLVVQSPNDTEVQAMKADLNTTAGDIASRKGSHQRALKYYETSIGVLSAVASANAKNGGAGQRLGGTYNSVGRAQLGLHNLDAAETSFKKAVSLVSEATTVSHPNMQALYTLADAYTGLGDVGTSRASDPRLKCSDRIQHWQRSATWYRQSAQVWRRVPEVGRVSPDAFDCVPPAAVARRLSQAEANVQKVSGKMR